MCGSTVQLYGWSCYTVTFGTGRSGGSEQMAGSRSSFGSVNQMSYLIEHSYTDPKGSIPPSHQPPDSDIYIYIYRSLHCLAPQHALPSASAVACGTSCFQRKVCDAIAVHSMVPDLQLSKGLTHRASAALAGCSSRKSSATQSRLPVGEMSFRSKSRK